MYMSVLSRNIPLVCLVSKEESIKSLRTGATDFCELPCGYWEPHQGSLKEYVFLNTEQCLCPLLIAYISTDK